MSSPLSLLNGALLYRAGVALRNWAYDRGILPTYRSALKVICVGNLTTGGNGKSPVTQAIARQFQTAGLKPVILLRGYGGSLSGPLVVTESHLPAEVGDEACMHREALSSVPVVVSRSRVAGARFIENEKLGKVIILDDGFQHRALARDINLLLFDHESLKDAEGGELLPAGRLREPLSSALRRVSAVLLIRRGVDPVERSAWLPGSVPAFQVDFALDGFTDLATREELSWNTLRGKKISAIASIAKPAQFLQMLRAGGFEIASELTGRDHEQWDSRTAQKLNALPGEIAVTTAKDAVKLRPLSGITKKVIVSRLTVRLPENFSQWLLTILS